MGGPIPTIDTSNRFALVTAFLSKYFTGVIGADVRQPMPTVTAVDHNALITAHLGLVTVAGQEYQIADIGLRMLTPRELARAQGFEDSYILTGSKAAQVAKIGNSVCPPIAAALVAENVELKERVKVG